MSLSYPTRIPVAHGRPDPRSFRGARVPRRPSVPSPTAPETHS